MSMDRIEKAGGVARSDGPGVACDQRFAGVRTLVRRPRRRPLRCRGLGHYDDHRNDRRRGGGRAAAVACRGEATWQIVAVEPPRRFAYRWHPFAVDANVDYENEPTTLVEFTLLETADGVLLRIVESGFDAIPQARRADAFEANSGGWARQTELVRKYLALEQRA
jgi:uncharacterized protein YndB with AHSA1/START domain